MDQCLQVLQRFGLAQDALGQRGAVYPAPSVVPGNISSIRSTKAPRVLADVHHGVRIEHRHPLVCEHPRNG
jgi:hypothetical protein